MYIFLAILSVQNHSKIFQSVRDMLKNFNCSQKLIMITPGERLTWCNCIHVHFTHTSAATLLTIVQPLIYMLQFCFTQTFYTFFHRKGLPLFMKRLDKAMLEQWRSYSSGMTVQTQKERLVNYLSDIFINALKRRKTGMFVQMHNQTFLYQLCRLFSRIHNFLIGSFRCFVARGIGVNASSTKF